MKSVPHIVTHGRCDAHAHITLSISLESEKIIPKISNLDLKNQEVRKIQRIKTVLNIEWTFQGRD